MLNTGTKHAKLNYFAEYLRTGNLGKYYQMLTKYPEFVRTGTFVRYINLENFRYNEYFQAIKENPITFNKMYFSLILDIYDFCDKNCKEMYWKINFITTIILPILKNEHIIEFYNIAKYQPIITKIAKFIFENLHSFYSHNNEHMKKSLSTELLFVTCYLDNEFNVNCNRNINTMFQNLKALNTITYEKRSCHKGNINLLDISQELQETILYKLLKDIKVSNKCVINSDNNIVTSGDVLSYYYGYKNVFQLGMTHKKDLLIVHAIKSYVPTEEEFLYYLKSPICCLKTMNLFLNYKLSITNGMLNDYLSSLPKQIIYDSNYCINNPQSDILSLLITAMIEPLDKNIIKFHLIAIVNNFELTPNLIETLDVSLDELYYACYLTYKVMDYDEIFKEPKYQLRSAATTMTMKNFMDKMRKLNLPIDNYCYELCVTENNHRSIVDYFTKTYFPTFYSASGRGKNAERIMLIAKKYQTREYMESTAELL